MRHGATIGSPIAMLLENKDWKNWQESLPVEPGDPGQTQAGGFAAPGARRSGGRAEIQFFRSSLCAGTCLGARIGGAGCDWGLAKLFLRELGIDVLSHVVAVGNASIGNIDVPWEQIRRAARLDEVLLNCADADAEQRMKEEVDKVLKTGDSVGGVFEVVAHKVPPGLGTYAQWDERLDGLLAGAVMSLQAVKAVEIGWGVTAAASPGSAVHDEIGYSEATGFAGFTRSRNNAGGIEGGVSNGEDIRVRGYLKPISTLRRPLQSVDFASREPVKAAYERSDVCVVPAAGVAAEAMVALTLARCALEKFGGDSMVETLRNFKGYLEQLKKY